MLSVMTDGSSREDCASMLDEICRTGAQRMLEVALEEEVAEYVERHLDELDEAGHRFVVRNGHAEPRTVTTVAGSFEVSAPRVHDRRVDPDSGERLRFKSSILPPWCRRSPKVTEVLPLLYLHGLSTKDFTPALAEFFGADVGLSASVVTRLAKSFEADHEAFMSCDLSEVDYVYVWVDGVHFSIRLEDARLCALVIVGVRTDGRKELVAICDGYRESSDSWSALLHDLRRRGMRAPVLAVGDGALGFWKALREVFPETKEQRDWVHKGFNVLAALPGSHQPLAKKMLAEIRDAEDRDHARHAAKAFIAEFEGRWPKAADKIRDDLDELLCFYDFPLEHWVHLKTTNPIESTFSPVRARTRVTKGAGSRSAGLAMAFKLIEAASERWRSVNSPHLVALVRAGAKFRKGVLVERDPLVQEVAA
jgi:putative transposase